MAKAKQENSILERLLQDELCRLQHRTRIGYEVSMKWLPGVTKYNDGKRLAEEVIGNTIIIYEENAKECIELICHGFAEWILNQNTKPYRQLINKLITLFEDLQYEKKERIIEALTRLL